MALPLDHVAFRVPDRDKAFAFFELLGYTKLAEFELKLEDGSKAQAYALTHPQQVDLFVSSGPPDSLIGRWVKEKGGMGAVHHMAYAVADVAATMAEWKTKGVEFFGSEPIRCQCPTPLVQVFTKPHPATGVIVELIERNGHPGFCLANVQRLMNSSAR